VSESLENAKFYHGVALPRQSLAIVLRKPGFFLRPQKPLCYSFCGNKGFCGRIRLGMVCGAAREFAEFAKERVQNQSQRGETMTRRLVTGALVGALAAVFLRAGAARK
jgi:hypothetical protein